MSATSLLILPLHSLPSSDSLSPKHLHLSLPRKLISRRRASSPPLPITSEGLPPSPSFLPHGTDSSTLYREMVSLLRSCDNLQHLKQIHARLFRLNLHMKIFFVTQLVALYAAFAAMDYALRLFDFKKKKNVFLWNAMIRGYSKSACPHRSIEVFCDMLLEFRPDEFTFPYLLRSCESICEGKQVHAHVWKAGLDDNVFACSALIAMYGNFGAIGEAHKVFDKMPERDVVCWNVIITGYSRAGNPEMVLFMFQQMVQQEIVPTSVTMVNVLGACGDTGALIQGRWIHEFTVRNKIQMNLFVETALIAMYSKCGDVEAARKVFDEAEHRDLVLWSAMLGGYGMNGCGMEALELFSLMETCGLKPDSITFVSLLSACSHAGLVEECLNLFSSMSKGYGIEPEIEHYACVVDLLGRCGQLEEAIRFIECMPKKPGASIWGALLGASRVHGDVALAEKAADRLFELEPENAGNYVLLCNLYVDCGRLTDAMGLRRAMRKKKIKKVPGCSLIEVGNRVNSFTVGSKSHPESERIYAALEWLNLHAMELGYQINGVSFSDD
ncbi:pentatricopeptide repeat-containing protein At5g43790-like [Nymphaea colorata]|nr:pentatricopeptide repeat-containing protein At5g43790-like [Nymphaea colorata]